jgi:hypothetical protein
MIGFAKVFCFLLFLVLSICASGQSDFGVSINGLCADLKSYKRVYGEKYIDKRLFKNFAIILRDTCNLMNRFSEAFVHQKVDISNDFYYPWLLIDSASVEEAEGFLSKWVDTIPEDKKGKLFKSKRGIFFKYIRDYGGFVDQAGDHYVAIQFLTKRQFTRYNKYGYQFDLFSLRPKKDKLRFIILKIHNGMVSVNSLFL